MHSSKLRWIALSLGLILLTGCGAGGYSACPPLVDYSKADEAKAADELALLPQPSVIERMLGDYSVTRGQLRVCQK